MSMAYDARQTPFAPTGLSTLSPRAALFVIILICLIVRVPMVFDYSPRVDPDTSDYVRLGSQFLSMNFTGYTGERTPAYPLLLAVAGFNWKTVQVIQSILGVCIASMLFAIVHLRTHNVLAAFSTALLYSLNLNQLFYESTILTETLCTFFATLSLLFFGRACIALKAGTTDYVLLGVTAALATMTRPECLFLAPLYFVCLELLQRRSKPMLARRLKVLTAVLVPAMSLSLGWSIFNKIEVRYFGISVLSGYSLATHSGAFMELAPPEYSTIRDIYLKYRAKRTAETGKYVANSIYDADPEIRRVTGLSEVELSRQLGRMSLILFYEHPLLYLRGVLQAWWRFWQIDPHWRKQNFRTRAFAHFLNSAWNEESPILRLVNGMFLIFATYHITQLLRRRMVLGFDTCAIAIVLVASVLQACTFGGNPRYAIPTQPFVTCVVVISLWKCLTVQMSEQRH